MSSHNMAASCPGWHSEIMVSIRPACMTLFRQYNPPLISDGTSRSGSTHYTKTCNGAAFLACRNTISGMVLLHITIHGTLRYTAHYHIRRVPGRGCIQQAEKHNPGRIVRYENAGIGGDQPMRRKWDMPHPGNARYISMRHTAHEQGRDPR